MRVSEALHDGRHVADLLSFPAPETAGTVNDAESSAKEPGLTWTSLGFKPDTIQDFSFVCVGRLVRGDWLF